MGEKKKSAKKWMVAGGLVLVAAAGTVLVLPRIQNSGEKTVRNVNTETITTGTIRVTTEGNGSIEAANEKTVSSDYTFKVASVNVENGDVIKEGDLIAKIDEESISEQIEQMITELDNLNSSISSTSAGGSANVTTSIGGRVKRIHVKSGEVLEDVLRDHGSIMEISMDGKLKIEFTSSEKLSYGDKVTVSFLNYDVEGTVASAADDTYTITIPDDANYQVDTEATIMNADETVIGKGYLKSNRPYYVDARYGVADAIKVNVGDSVSSGAVVLTRTNYDYNQSYLSLIEDREELMTDLQELRKLESDPEIRAEEDGIISDLVLQANATVSEGSEMYHVISTDTFWLKTDIDELDIVNVQEGQEAEIVFDAFEDESYEGKVKKVSALGENVGGVTKYQVTIEVPGVEKAKMAMSATATIVMEEKSDVLLVPVDAVEMVDGQKCVTVLNSDNTTETVPVTLGLVNNTMAEVTEGLEEGDQIVVNGGSGGNDFMEMIQKQGPGGGI